MGRSSQGETEAGLGSLRLPLFAKATESGPFLVAIEGPNGAGKTTLVGNLSRLMALPTCLGIDPAWFTEPFKVRMIRDAEWYASAMFFFSGCIEQTRVLRGQPDPVVIMDRSLWSTLAVHAAQDPQRLRALLQMLEPIAGFITTPHLTIVLEASFQTCGARIAQKSGSARALDELTANEPFFQRELGFYRWLASQTSTLAFINADVTAPESLAQQAAALIRSKLC